MRTIDLDADWLSLMQKTSQMFFNFTKRNATLNSCLNQKKMNLNTCIYTKINVVTSRIYALIQDLCIVTCWQKINEILISYLH